MLAVCFRIFVIIEERSIYCTLYVSTIVANLLVVLVSSIMSMSDPYNYVSEEVLHTTLVSKKTKNPESFNRNISMRGRCSHIILSAFRLQ